MRHSQHNLDRDTISGSDIAAAEGTNRLTGITRAQLALAFGARGANPTAVGDRLAAHHPRPAVPPLAGVQWGEAPGSTSRGRS